MIGEALLDMLCADMHKPPVCGCASAPAQELELLLITHQYSLRHVWHNWEHTSAWA